jgi:hypothetical protein
MEEETNASAEEAANLASNYEIAAKNIEDNIYTAFSRAS